MFMRIRLFVLITMIFFKFTELYSVTTYSKKTVSDTNVEQLMSVYRFREVSNLIIKNLKSRQNLNVDHRLYYYNHLSLAQLRLRNLDSARTIALQALALSEKSKDSVLIVDTWKVLAYAYNNRGKLDSALLFTEKMLRYGYRHGDELLTRNAIISMATILSQNKRYKEALQYYRNADKLTIKLRDSSNFSTCKYNLGLTLMNLRRTDSSL